jgi:hypothetical protein
MLFRLACLVASTFDQSDWLKLLGLVSAVVALYLVAKRLGSGDETVPPPIDTPVSTQHPSAYGASAEYDASPGSEKKDDSEDPDYEEDPLTTEEEMQPRNTEIRDWNFVKFEIEAGPPHPDSFVDELLVNLYDKSTGQGWNKSYLVATPAGLEEILRKRKSNFIFLPQTLVMNRYDVNQLRKAVLGDLGAMEEERGDVPRDGTDATAPGHQTDL